LANGNSICLLVRQQRKRQRAVRSKITADPFSQCHVWVPNRTRCNGCLTSSSGP
jgi:hypothetical protein